VVRLLLLAACVAVSTPALAQETASLSGRIVGGAGGEAVPFAPLTLLPGDQEAVSDEQGRFRFDRVPPGPVQLVIAADGWQRLTLDAVLREGEDLEVEAHLRRGRRPRNETVIREDPPWREVRRTPVVGDRGLEPGLVSLSARDLERQPGSLGDPLRALQNRPETSGDVGNQAFLQVRGGVEDETILEIDGLRVRAPLHMAGVVSMFGRDLLDSVDLYALSPPASRPDGLSGGLFARYREDASDRFDGTIDLSFLAGSVAIQSQLDPAGKHHLVVGARQSFIAAYLAAAADAFEGSPPTGDYGETFVRYTGEPAPRHTVRATLLLSRDSFQFDDVNEQHGMVGASVDWRHEFALDCSFELQVAHSTNLEAEPPAEGFRYPLSREWRDDSHRTHLRAAFRHGDRDREVALGLEASVTDRSFEGEIRDDRGIPRWAWLPLAELDLPLRDLDASVVTPEVIVWGEVVWRNLLGPLSVRAGVRASLWNRAKTPHVSPRVALTLPLPSGTTFGGSFALMHQQRDDALVIDPDAGSDTLLPERAFHLSLSVDQVVVRGVVVRLEGWHKAYDQLVVFPDEDLEHGTWTNDGYGEASGLDFTAQGSVGRFDGSFGYGLSRSVRTNPLATVFEAESAAAGDRRHFLHGGANVRLGRRQRFMVGANYLFRTGWALGSVERHALDDGRTAVWGVTALDDRRRPDLHRISVRAEGTHPLRTVRIRGYVEVAATAAGGGSIEDCPSTSDTAALPTCRDLDFLPSIMPWAGIRADW
jgi:hypothetical protein